MDIPYLGTSEYLEMFERERELKEKEEAEEEKMQRNKCYRAEKKCLSALNAVLYFSHSDVSSQTVSGHS